MEEVSNEGWRGRGEEEGAFLSKKRVASFIFYDGIYANNIDCLATQRITLK